MESLNWDDLRVVLVVARAGSLSRAAGRLGLSVATVGRRLTRLETHLGQTLFTRHPGGLEVTPEGEDLVQYAAAVAERVADLSRSVQAQDAAISGVVTVTSIDALIVHVLGPSIATLRARHPNLDLVLRSSARVERLDGQRAEIALRMVRPTGARLVTRRLGALKYGLYASQSYVERRGMPTLESLREHDVVMLDTMFDPMPEMLWLAQHAGPPALRVSSTTSVASMVQAGAGISLLATVMTTPDLVTIATGIDVPSREVWLVLHEDLKHTPRVRAVADHLAATTTAALAAG